ncbi:YeiH family protein [Posidoniimonas corsicana]|uniref:YeiH family protein n=1 Tax=Posidoniimonas corsicana TaxID=1938618 RepID=UPI001E313442|nr:putative sulfate exporter family transporter [Posidoniimonas corsicana]
MRAALASDDWAAVVIGGGLLAASLTLVAVTLPTGFAAAHADGVADAPAASNPLDGWFGKPGKWDSNPLHSVWRSATENQAVGVLGTLTAGLVLFGAVVAARGESVAAFAKAFVGLFALALLALVVTAQSTIKAYNLEYALWALVIGLAISNTVGLPGWLKPATRTELYIKTGLVLYGAKVLIGTLYQLGGPGLAVAWVVTPVVLVSTYWFGQKVLGIESRTLNMVISADMSVCGVSAAIATASACRAKQRELTLAISISLMFTVVMMILLPMAAVALGLSEEVGGAWIGGTIDSTGAVVASGQALGERAATVAITIKLIQNLLIGVTAFGVALYWVRYVDRDSGAKPSLWEVWTRFPKFVIGFLGASVVFSAVQAWAPGGELMVDAALKQGTEPLRSWFFCLAFVSIGLESNFRELAGAIEGGKPLLLYVCGQSLNLALTLAMASLVF